MKKELEKHGYQVDVRPYQRWYESTDSAVTIALRGNRPYYPKEELIQKNIMWNISHPADIPQGEYERFDLVYFAIGKTDAEKGKTEIKNKMRCAFAVCRSGCDEEYCRQKRNTICSLSAIPGVFTVRSCRMP